MFSELSRKQLLAMSWWSGPDFRDREAVICDGAVRSGKTLCMGLGFFLWAMESFEGQIFGLCGKTVKSLRRNLLSQVVPILKEEGFECRDNLSQSRLELSKDGKTNSFYIFGGRDEGSAALIQGVTFAGVLMDEVVLMPRSFVEQACARCSVAGSKLWFSCNPEGPQHWFYREWICKAEERRALYIHFTMEDNPSLGAEVIARYARTFTGVFRRRFVEGQWVAGQGLVYDFFSTDMVKPPPAGEAERWVVSCDYGTANPASFGLWGLYGGVWYRVKEFYFDSRSEGYQKTDGEYVAALRALCGGRAVDCVVVDPSAASFILALSRRGFRVVRAKNDVLSGIRITAEKLKSGEMVICDSCVDAIREFGLYRWKSGGESPVKEQDHAMDDIRYFAATVAGAEAEGFGAVAVERFVR